MILQPTLLLQILEVLPVGMMLVGSGGTAKCINSNAMDWIGVTNGEKIAGQRCSGIFCSFEDGLKNYARLDGDEAKWFYINAGIASTLSIARDLVLQAISKKI